MTDVTKRHLSIRANRELAGVPAAVDVLRRWVAPVALLVGVVAAATDPAGWLLPLLLGIPLATFVVWERWPTLPVSLLVAAVVVPVGATQVSGRLEPAMFLLSLLAIVVARWVDSWWRSASACLVLGFSPLVIVALQPADNHIAWGLWVIGIALPAILGRALHRQDQLVAELEEARRELALRAQDEERRRIARDVHDLVGHGLAAVLMQVSSARHVLRTDIDAADEALTSAEVAGRRSMRDLRGTMTLLRDSGDSSVGVPPPHLTQLDGLVEAFRAGGLSVECRPVGNCEAVDPAVGLALYRIAQEALTNASRHAGKARTLVTVEVAADVVCLEVDSIGPVDAQAPNGGPRYGLIGMRERATSVGAEVTAGPTEKGWRVRCAAPVIRP